MVFGPIYGDGRKTRDYVYINDVVETNVAAMSRGLGQIFNIDSDIAPQDTEVLSVVATLLRKPDLQPR